MKFQIKVYKKFYILMKKIKIKLKFSKIIYKINNFYMIKFNQIIHKIVNNKIIKMYNKKIC